MVLKVIAFAVIMGLEYASLFTIISVFFFWSFLHDEDEFSSLFLEIKRKLDD